MTTTIVCPLDGYPNAERALPSAFDAAKLFGASLELFSAVEDPHMVARREAYLEQVGAERRCTGTSKPSIEVLVNPHAPEAVAERSDSPDIVTVMATSSQPIMHTGYLGSAAERVARDAYNPTVLIGPHNETRLCDVDRVIVPCDGSQLSESVLPKAREWADRLEVGLWIVTSLSSRDSGQPGYNPDTEANYVRRLAQQVDAQWEVLHGQNPAKTVVQWAGPALIAMTTHGRSGLSRVTVGSVAVGVTRWAKGPVLVANCRHNEPGSM